MKRLKSLFFLSIVILLLTTSTSLAAVEILKLPAPDLKGDMSLMQALSLRKSSRSYSDKSISDDILSNILWAAWGYNRPEKNKRTAPSAMNKQEINVYCALAEGLYLYNAKEHQLELISQKDLRAKTGKQKFAGTAALNLIYVADTKKQSNREYSFANTGFISQNVYLYCATQGLGTVVREWIDNKMLHKAMGLDKHFDIIMCQSIGYPKTN